MTGVKNIETAIGENDFFTLGASIGNIGKQLIPGGVMGPSHCDGICLNTSIWFDGVQFTDRGNLVQDEYIALEKAIRA